MPGIFLKTSLSSTMIEFYLVTVTPKMQGFSGGRNDMSPSIMGQDFKAHREGLPHTWQASGLQQNKDKRKEVRS